MPPDGFALQSRAGNNPLPSIGRLGSSMIAIGLFLMRFVNGRERYFRKIFSIDFPLASSSTSLSR